MKKSIKISLIIVLLLGLYVANTLYQSGYLKTIENHFEGTTTKKIEGLVGTEDITIDQSTGFTFLSSDDRWASRAKNLLLRAQFMG